MTNRTVQLWGQGYSLPPAGGLTLTPCTINATFDGNVVFSGTIPTLEQTDVNRQPNEQTILFTFEIPLVTATANNTSYTAQMSLDITGDDVFIEQFMTNYCALSDGTSSGPAGFYAIYNTDGKSNVVITNAVYSNPPPNPRPPGQDGSWGWEIETAPGQTSNMSFTLTISSGKDVV